MSAITGKVIAITGASSGIGEATARYLAKEGARVVLGARRTDRLETLVEAIRAEGGTAFCRALDVTSRADMDAFAREAVREYGRLDVFINNAGVMPLLAARRAEGRGVGPDDRRQHPRRSSRHSRKHADHEGARERPDHQPVVDRRPRGFADGCGLLRDEIRRWCDLRRAAPGERPDSRDRDLAWRYRIGTGRNNLRRDGARDDAGLPQDGHCTGSDRARDRVMRSPSRTTWTSAN